MRGIIKIDFDKLIHSLVCLYAFFIPLEKILEVFLGIDTVFKPYRVLAILIFAVFAVKMCYRWTRNTEIKKDVFLYLIFAYGLIITLYRMITTNFGMSHMLNDGFQTGLYVGVFVVMRHINLDMKRLLVVLKSLAIGVIANAFFVFYNFYVLQGYTRGSGMMDNPNFLAFSLLVVMLLMISRRSKLDNIYKKVAWAITLFFLAYVFIIAGSRTNLVILAIGLLINFFFSSGKDKRTLIGFGLITFFLLEIGGATSVRKSGPLILVQRTQRKSAEDNRIPVWKGVLRASEATNYMGLGLGQFKTRFREFYYEENNLLIRRMIERNFFLTSHSDYLELLVVYGIPGLICYLIFLILSGRDLWYRLRSTSNPEHKIYYQFGLIVFVGLLLFGITSENFGSALFWILLGISTKIEFANEELIEEEPYSLTEINLT